MLYSNIFYNYSRKNLKPKNRNDIMTLEKTSFRGGVVVHAGVSVPASGPPPSRVRISVLIDKADTYKYYKS